MPARRNPCNPEPVPAMKTAAKIIAPLALVGTILPSVLFLFKAIGEGPMKLIMLMAAVAWFAAAPFWMKGGSD